MMDDDRARLFDPRPDVTPVEMDVFLSRKGRTAGNLIAAWQLTTNLPFLEDAAGRFPDDPTVQFAVLQSGLYPEQRRQWLDRFKASAPNNALASLLSAHEHIQQGDFRAALADIRDSLSRPEYNDYFRERVLNSEGALFEIGESTARSKLAALHSSLELKHLGQLKGVFQDEPLRNHVRTRGPEEWSRYAESALKMAEDLRGTPTLMNHLVAGSIEAGILGEFPQNEVVPWLGVTPAERLSALAETRAERRALLQNLNRFMAEASEADVINYLDRFKTLGEVEALRWVQQRRALNP